MHMPCVASNHMRFGYTDSQPPQKLPLLQTDKMSFFPYPILRYGTNIRKDSRKGKSPDPGAQEKAEAPIVLK